MSQRVPTPLSNLFFQNGALYKLLFHILTHGLEEVWKTEIMFQYLNSISVH